MRAYPVPLGICHACLKHALRGQDLAGGTAHLDQVLLHQKAQPLSPLSQQVPELDAACGHLMGSVSSPDSKAGAP